MAEESGIAWTRSTFNPWIGCTKVGPGCDHCYAENQDSRKRWGGVAHWGPGVARMRTGAGNWAGPVKWNKQAPSSEFAGRPGFWPVFCASLADVFDNEVDPAWRQDLWGLVLATPNLSWLLVTKRVGNVARMVPAEWMADGFPANVRLLITVVDQEEADRDVPKLLALPCRNGISYEPALGPVDWWPWLCPHAHVDWSRGRKRKEPTVVERKAVIDLLRTSYYQMGGRLIEWIIVGGESAQGAPARPFHLDWGRSTVRQGRMAGVPVFVKQIGSRAQSSPEEAVQYGQMMRDRAGADPAEWPLDLRVREFPV